jgi:hypothetical protein
MSDLAPSCITDTSQSSQPTVRIDARRFLVVGGVRIGRLIFERKSIVFQDRRSHPPRYVEVRLEQLQRALDSG